jgi:hypothetical protein
MASSIWSRRPSEIPPALKPAVGVCPPSMNRLISRFVAREVALRHRLNALRDAAQCGYASKRADAPRLIWASRPETRRAKWLCSSLEATGRIRHWKYQRP